VPKRTVLPITGIASVSQGTGVALYSTVIVLRNALSLKGLDSVAVNVEICPALRLKGLLKLKVPTLARLLPVEDAPLGLERSKVAVCVELIQL
jgi:hypothetical protein